MTFSCCNPSGRWDEVLVHESEGVITDLLEFSFHFRDVFLRVRCLLLVVLLSFFVCNLFLSVSNLSCRLGFLLSFGNLLDLNLPPSHVFRSSASFAAIDLASSAICSCLLPLLLFLCHALPYIFFVLLLLKRFLDSLQLLSASQLQSSFQS